MATATMTTIDPILKEVYGPRIESQTNEEVVALKRIESTSDNLVDDPGGKYVNFPIRVTRNNGVGARGENEALPAAGNQGYATVKVGLKYLYGVVRLTGQMMRLAQSNKQAFANAADREMEGLKDDLVKDMNRQVYGDATGLLASVVSDGANIVNVDNTQYLEVGMQIDILVRATGVVVASDRTITAISGLAVTYSGADVVGANTQGLYRQGTFASATSREINGFANIISASATLHQLTVAAQPKWASSVLANGGTNRALSEGLMIQMADTIRAASGKKPSAIFNSLGVRRSYFNLLTQQRRFTETKSYEGGFQGLPFNYGTEIPVVEDVDAPPSKMWFVNEDSFKKLKAEDWTWADDDGSIFSRVSGYDAYDAFCYKYMELACSQRNANGLLSDITEG
jgi:hypothetical protein